MQYHGCVKFSLTHYSHNLNVCMKCGCTAVVVSFHFAVPLSLCGEDLKLQLRCYRL